jgi:glycosyltransferase involved in cell wall biosynthesis
MTRVLVLDDGPPEPSLDGSSLRLLTMLELLIELGYEVGFATWGWPAGPSGSLQMLTHLGIELPGQGDPIERLIADHASDYDIVVLSRLATASRLLNQVRDAAPAAYLVYDATFLGHLNSYRLAKRAGNAPLLVKALSERRDEIKIVNSVDAVIAVSDDDAALIREYGATCPVGVVTAAHMDPIAGLPARSDRSDAVFVGYFRNRDNQEAARRLVDAVWPAVARRLPEELLHLVGAAAPAWLGSSEPSWLRRHGKVIDIDPILRNAAVSPVPISGGTGIKTKILQSFAYGIPVVGTEDALRGIPVVDGEHVLRAETDMDLAEAVVRVLEDAELWARLSAGGTRLLSERFGRAAAVAGLRTVLVAP